MNSGIDSVKMQLLKRLRDRAVPRMPGDSSTDIKKGTDNSDVYEIPRVSDQPFYPVSFAQKRMFLLHQIDPLSVGYNLPLAMVIEGGIDEQRFQLAVDQLVERHECFRTGIRLEDDHLVQSIEREVHLPVERFIIKEEEILVLMEKFCRPFDIVKPPLARIAIAELGFEHHLLLVDIHHIVSDGMSLQVILRDLMSLYLGQTLTPLRLRYSDYAVWQEKWFESEEAKKQEEFWLNTFDSELPTLDLHTDFPRPEVPVSVGSHVDFSFTPTETASLKKLSRNWGTTDYTVLLGLFSVLLSKYTGQQDIVVGSPVAGRRYPEMQELVGMFVNTIAIRSRPISTMRFSDYIKELREIVLSSLDSQDYPFESVVENAGVVRNINRNPIFDVMFSMLNMKKTTAAFNDLKVSSYPFKREVANFDLELYMSEENSTMQFRLEYNASLFLHETVEQMVRHFKYVTEQILAQPNLEISMIQLLDKTEQLDALQRHCGVQVDDDGLVLVQVFEDQVRKTPQAQAVVCEHQTLTYSELNNLANRVANGLIQLGICVEELVTLWLDRDLEYPAAMLGIFKAAAAYVPVDPALPGERKRMILEESGSRIIITEAKYEVTTRELASPNVKVILLEDLLSNMELVDNPSISVLPKNLAYVIFTSGSTGKPKGAMIEHRGMLNHIRAKIIDLKLNHLDRIAETATQSFDVSVWQFLTALIAGGTTIVFKGVSAWQPKLLLEGIIEHRVTLLETVPSHLVVLLEEFEKSYGSDNALPLRFMMLNGELLLSELCRRWFQLYPDIPIVNSYGPTECSDDVTQYHVRNPSCLPGSSVPISGALAGMHIYVLDEKLNQVAKGIVGDLYIGGVGVGRGYLADPMKTAAIFLPDMFSKVPGKRMYKTGDLVRELAEGIIEFLGRNDHQVKINGMRIELSEIEHTLLATQMIRETVVIAGNWGGDQEKQLCAYVVLKPGIELSTLQVLITSSLPSHMVPALWICLPSLPLLINGKVDRKSLPLPDLNALMSREYRPPTTDIQCYVAKLWSEILNIEESSIGLHTDFFQLGGNSIKAMRLVSKVRSQTGVELPFTSVFSAPLLSGFSELFQQINESNKNKCESPAMELPTRLPALAEHLRIHWQDMNLKQSVVFNMPFQCLIEGEFEAERAEAAFRAVSDRHWMMRASFFQDEAGEWFLQADPALPIEFSAVRASEEEISKRWNEFVKPFSVDQTLLFRMQVLSVSPKRHYLFFDNHTLGADFTSKQLILRDFVSFYLGKPMDSPALNYPDYIAQRISRASGTSDISQYSLWKDHFPDSTKRLMSQDFLKLKEFGPETAKRVVITIAEKLLSKISTISKTHSVSEHSVVMSVFSLALSGQFGQDSFFLLSPVTDRDIPDFEDLVGLLFDTVPVPQSINPNATFAQHLEQTHQNSLKAYSQRDFPAITTYDQLARLDKGWTGGFFDTTFVWVEAESFDYEEAGFSVHEIINEQPMARFDLRLEAFRGETDLRLIVEYRECLFLSSTIDRLMKRFISLLECMVNDTSEKVSVWREPVE